MTRTANYADVIAGGIGVRAEGIAKSFGDTHALKGVDLEVPVGTVLGLLGHNGAGKTTMLRILTTLTKPSAGKAWVAGHDVLAAPAKVRERIGVAGQAATVDGLLGVRMNLEMVGRLYHFSAAEARKRADELLEKVALADVATKRTDTLSGGMRRRLDLAAALVAQPPVLFLDEPTTGLDPHARNELWTVLREHVRDGATLVLTTQYLEEADRLADQVVVLDHGSVVARGTPTELKRELGGDRLVISFSDSAHVERAQPVMAPFAEGPMGVFAPEKRLEVPIKQGTRLVEVVRALDAAGIEARDIAHRHASLDDVFLSLTAAAKKEAA
ncbi:MAG TPA: ATP-binding cassette domain-containing protein [Kofleriaceae bacterium]|jgi:ABC-2 type transport system ATP-binding protein